MFKKMRLQLDRLIAVRKALFETDASAKPAKLVSFYTRIMTKATDSERCSVFVHDPGRNIIWLKAGTGVQEHDIEVPKQDSVVGKVIASGQPVIVSDLEAKSGAHKTVGELTGFVARNILCVPIKSSTRNEITGAFELLNKKNNQNFTDEDLSLAQEIAEHLQVEVDAIFLDQEVFGLTEQLYSATRTIMNFLAMAIVLVVVMAVLALPAAWGIVLTLLGG